MPQKISNTTPDCEVSNTTPDCEVSNTVPLRSHKSPTLSLHVMDACEKYAIPDEIPKVRKGTWLIYY